MPRKKQWALIWWYETNRTDVVPQTNVMKHHRVAGMDSTINKNKIRVLAIGGKCNWNNLNKLNNNNVIISS